MSNEAKIKKFLDSLTNFKNSAIALSTYWEEIGRDDELDLTAPPFNIMDMGELGSEKYPFNTSFDEVVFEICRWEKKQRRLLTAKDQSEVKK